jgi:PAS domain S-box-containing protein
VNEEHYRDLVENSLDLMCTHDLNGVLLTVNLAAARTLGYEPRELVNRNLREFLSPEVRKEFDDYLVALGEKGASSGLMRLTTKGGETRIWKYTNTVRTEGVEVPVVRGIAHDFTDILRAQKALREGEERSRRIVQKSPVAMLVTHGVEQKNELINDKFTALFGYSIEDVPTVEQWWPLAYPDQVYREKVRAVWQARVTEAIKNRSEIAPMEAKVCCKDGSYRYIEFHFASLGETNLVSFVDLTARKNAEDALRESEERLRLAVRAGKMYAFEWDTLSDVIVRSEQYAEILNWTVRPTPDTGRQFIARVHPDDRKIYAATETGPTPDNPTYQTSYRLLRPEGGVVWLEESGYAFFNDQGRMLRIIGVVADVTERKLADEALSSVSRRLIEAQERERARIARELHDDLSQRLALLSISLEQFKRGVPDLPSEARKQLRRIEKIAMDVSSDIHNLSHQLHPAKLDTLGLVAALGGLCREFSNQHNLQVQFVHHDISGRISKDVTLCLFRIAQEALRNVVKHSGAAEAKVALSGHDDRIDLCIFDPGVGFSPESANGVAGLGLISMRERLRLVGGHLSVESKPSRGTRILVSIPRLGTSAPVDDGAHNVSNGPIR